MIRKLVFALACIVTTTFAGAAPAAADDIHYRQAMQRCHMPNCAQYSEEGASTLFFIVQHETLGQNLIACEHAYTPCRVVRRAWNYDPLPAVEVLLPPRPHTTPSPTGDEADKDEEPPVAEQAPVIRRYQVAPGVLQPNPQ